MNEELHGSGTGFLAWLIHLFNIIYPTNNCNRQYWSYKCSASTSDVADRKPRSRMSPLAVGLSIYITPQC